MCKQDTFVCRASGAWNLVRIEIWPGALYRIFLVVYDHER